MYYCILFDFPILYYDVLLYTTIGTDVGAVPDRQREAARRGAPQCSLMRNLLGWLEARLAHITLNYLKLA